MSISYAPSRLSVPTGFEYVLEGLAREVLREQPKDIIAFAADYFKTKLILRDEGGLTDTPLHTKPAHHTTIEQEHLDLQEQTSAESSDIPQVPPSEPSGPVELKPQIEDTESETVSDVDEPGDGSQTGSLDASGVEEENAELAEQKGQIEPNANVDTTGDEGGESDVQEEVPVDEDTAEEVDKLSEQALSDTAQAREEVGLAQDEVGVVSDDPPEERESNEQPLESEQTDEGSKVIQEDQPVEAQVHEDTNNTKNEGEEADLPVPTEQERTDTDQKLSSTDLVNTVDQSDESAESQAAEPGEVQADNPEESQETQPESTDNSKQDEVVDENQVSTEDAEPTGKEPDMPPGDDQSS